MWRNPWCRWFLRSHHWSAALEGAYTSSIKGPRPRSRTSRKLGLTRLCHPKQVKKVSIWPPESFRIPELQIFATQTKFNSSPKTRVFFRESFSENRTKEKNPKYRFFLYFPVLSCKKGQNNATITLYLAKPLSVFPKKAVSWSFDQFRSQEMWWKKTFWYCQCRPGFYREASILDHVKRHLTENVFFFTIC